MNKLFKNRVKMDESIRKEFDFLFVDNIEPPFKVQPSDLTDPKKYLEVMKINNELKLQNDKVADKCDKLKEELMKIKELTDKIRTRVEEEKIGK